MNQEQWNSEAIGYLLRGAGTYNAEGPIREEGIVTVVVKPTGKTLVDVVFYSTPGGPHDCLVEFSASGHEQRVFGYDDDTTGGDDE